jgi:hypothetical protein
MPVTKCPKKSEPLWKGWEQKTQKNGLRHQVYAVNGDHYVGEWKDNTKHGERELPQGVRQPVWGWHHSGWAIRPGNPCSELTGVINGVPKTPISGECWPGPAKGLHGILEPTSGLTSTGQGSPDQQGTKVSSEANWGSGD